MSICDGLSRVIAACDFDNEKDAWAFISQLHPDKCHIKVGKELFTATGRQFVEKIIDRGFRVFLDLKFHDIPNTVAGAVKVAAQMGVWMVDVHACGGREMMMAARESVEAFSKKPLLIGVTVLTSMQQSDLKEIGLVSTIQDQVLNLAKLAQDSGMDGIVSSAQEVNFLKNQLRENFVYVTPGIRFKNSAKDDQKRIVTPEEALSNGSTFLVIGRPLRNAENPNIFLDEINVYS